MVGVRFHKLAVLAIVVALCGAASADSLWKPTSQSVYADKKAAKLGDLVTINIVESSSASQQSNSAVSKKSATSLGPGVGPVLKNIPAMSMSGSGSDTATGSTSRSSTLVATITARVTEVKPNGDLVLEGTRNVTANNDTQVMKITGTVRPQDIASDNTIQSTLIADAKIEYTGKGPMAERQRPGIISRILKILF